MRIRWHGHACFEISNGKVIVIDPHDGVSIGIAPPKAKADIILITHDHFDHNQARIVEKEGSKIIDKGEINGIKIKSYVAYHDKERGAARGEIKIFKIEYNGIKFCHLGDLGHILDDDLINEIGEIDLLFIPVGGVFTINAKEAWELCRKMDAKVIVPMHYKIEGLSLPIDTIDKFLEIVNYEIRHVANEIEIEKEDLPKNKEVWVFSL
ncbi:MAG: Zn-dependent hydrolase [Thermoplasmata archaeon]|nr:MAG: Zn-dependent hydrolase [Thermoplasmata archaeon]